MEDDGLHGDMRLEGAFGCFFWSAFRVSKESCAGVFNYYFSPTRRKPIGLKIEIIQMSYGMALMALKYYGVLWMCSETPGHCLSEHWLKYVWKGIVVREVEIFCSYPHPYFCTSSTTSKFNEPPLFPKWRGWICEYGSAQCICWSSNKLPCCLLSGIHGSSWNMWLANVSSTVSSHTGGLPYYQGIKVAPSTIFRLFLINQ